MRFPNRDGHAITLTPRIMLMVEDWLDGRIGIQEFMDLTGCTTTSAYSTIARACRDLRAQNDL